MSVEFAMVVPLLFLIVFASIEFGRAFMAQHCLEAAALDGARAGIVHGATTSDVDSAVAKALVSAGISNYTVNVTPSGLSAVTQWSPVTVTVSVSYSSVSWLPVAGFLDGVTMTGRCTMPREADPV